MTRKSLTGGLRAAIAPALLFLLVLLFAGCDLIQLPADETRYQTCELCESTRLEEAGGSKIMYRSPAYANCEHDWRDGISNAHPKTVRDGQVVLLRRGAAVGAFILKNQSVDEDTARYDWWYRSDGKSDLDPQDQNVKHGTATGDQIRFGPFAVRYSACENGAGWLYYRRMPGSVPQKGDVRICVTEQTSVEHIDAFEDKWTYRASPVDEGLKGPE